MIKSKEMAENDENGQKKERCYWQEIRIKGYWWDGVYYPPEVIPASVIEFEPWGDLPPWQDFPAPSVNNNENTGDQHSQTGTF